LPVLSLARGEGGLVVEMLMGFGNRYVLVGYSQGAVVHHRATKEMSNDKATYAAVFERIIATVTFGDGGQQATLEKDYASPVGLIPAWPKELEGKVRFNCNGGDLVSSYATKERM